MQFCWVVSVELCWPTVSVVSFILANFQSSKRGIAPRKKLNQNALWICTSTHYFLHYYKVSGNSIDRFQSCACANKKYSSIFHFGQISKFKKGLTPRKKMESKFPVDMHIYTLCPSLLQSFRKFYWAVSEELR